MSAGLPYNGWPEQIRHGRDKHYYHARSEGVFRAASACDACGVSFGDQPISYHAEEYGPTLEDYWSSCVPLCHRCHAMVHARFATPNCWNLFLQQLAEGVLDEDLFPRSTQVAALLSKFKNRRDIASVERPKAGNAYLLALPMTDYAGPTKTATLLILDQRSQIVTEVPDWTIYGERLERLGIDERDQLIARGVRVDDFISGVIEVGRIASGERRYERLYLRK